MSAPLVWSMPVTAAEAAAALPYPGEDPTALAEVTDKVSDARGHLARLDDALLDAATALRIAWRGSTGALGESEVQRLRTATEIGTHRLDQVRFALWDCSGALSDVRIAIGVLRFSWSAAERRVREAEMAVQFCTDPTLLPGLIAVRDAARSAREGVLRSWRAEVAAADEATLDCAARVRRTLDGDQVYVVGRGVIDDGLGSALGTDSLVADDVYRETSGRVAAGTADSPDVTRWNALSSTAQAFALAAAGVFPPVAVVTTPGAQVTPTAVAIAWRARTPMQQQALLHADPAVLGALDGVPVAARDQANRSRLTAREAELGARLAALPELVTTGWGTAGRPAPAWNPYGDSRATATARERAQLTAELDNLRTVREQAASTVGGSRFLLGFDSSGRGQAVIALGDPDRAAQVVTYVPGTGSDIAGLPTELDRSGVMAESAAASGAADTAVVAWIGFRSPADVLDAAYDESADGAAPALVAFQSALRATHDGAASLNTVVGYSYGGLVVGTAAATAAGLDADQVVFIASTGLELDSVTQLHLTGAPADQVAARVFATAYDNDAIRDTGIAHENLPTDPEFGASVFLAGPYTGDYSVPVLVGAAVPGLAPMLGKALSAHSTGNWLRGSAPMVGTGAIIAGRRPPNELPRR